MINNAQLVEKIITARILLGSMMVNDESKQDTIVLARNELELPDNNLSENQLTEKVVKAKLHLEELSFNHTCMWDLDPDYTGPCTCGAQKNEEALNKVLKALKLS